MTPSGRRGMNKSRPTPVGVFVTLVGVALLTTGLIAVLACVATASMPDGPPVGAIVTGCGISWLASCAGAVPIASALASKSPQLATAILMATAVRFVAVLVLVVPLVLSDWFDRTTLVVCVGVSYLLTLLLDTLIAIQKMKRVFEDE